MIRGQVIELSIRFRPRRIAVLSADNSPWAAWVVRILFEIDAVNSWRGGARKEHFKLVTHLKQGTHD